MTTFRCAYCQDTVTGTWPQCYAKGWRVKFFKGNLNDGVRACPKHIAELDKVMK